MAETKLSAEEKLLRRILMEPECPIRSEVNGVTLGQAIEEALLSLTDKEVRVLQLHFGFDSDPMTLAAIGRIYDRGRERIRQIERKALRKLSHPQHSLRAYLSRSENE